MTNTYVKFSGARLKGDQTAFFIARITTKKQKLPTRSWGFSDVEKGVWFWFFSPFFFVRGPFPVERERQIKFEICHCVRGANRGTKFPDSRTHNFIIFGQN